MDQRLYCDDEVNVRAYRKMGYVKSDESNRNKSFPKLVLKKTLEQTILDVQPKLASEHNHCL